MALSAMERAALRTAKWWLRRGSSDGDGGADASSASAAAAGVGTSSAERQRSLPRHVAFIMDGNRRFAAQQGRTHAWEGHAAGYSSLLRVLEWCVALEVRVATVFAFSIENFKRPEAEVQRLMALAEQKFCEFLDKRALVAREGIRVRVLGDLSLLPAKVRRAAAKVMLATAANDRLTLNICFAYTAGEEMTRTLTGAVRAARAGLLRAEDLDDDFLARCLYTRESRPDLVIRTSGETRLSDFLVWQANRAHLCFVDVAWPALDVWRFLRCFWDYHAHAHAHAQPLQINAQGSAQGPAEADGEGAHGHGDGDGGDGATRARQEHQPRINYKLKGSAAKAEDAGKAKRQQAYLFSLEDLEAAMCQRILDNTDLR